jgi:hypothetical protein
MAPFRLNRLIPLLSVLVYVHGAFAGIRGRLANPGFENHPMKSVFFFAGNWRNGVQFYEVNPSSNIGLFTVHPADSRHLGWSEKKEYRDFAVQKLVDAGVNVINMSFWGPRGTDNWAYWAPMQTSTYSHDELFDTAVGKSILIAPYLETAAATKNSLGFSFMDCFPGENADPAPELIVRIKDLIQRYLLHPSNPKWPAKWARMIDLNGQERYVISLMHVASNRPGLSAAGFAEGFDRVAEKILSDTGIRIGFTLDALPPGTNAPGSYLASPSSTGPELAKSPSVLAVQCFLSEIWKGDGNESVLLAWKRQFASDWMHSGVPFIFDATPGYDARAVFPNSVAYGNNDAWWNAQMQIARDMKPDGVTFNAWNGYTEGMAGMSTLQYGDANARWAESLFTLADSLYGSENAAPNVPESPGIFRLNQNYPNPFNANTTIRFILPLPGYVRLRVFDPAGREVTTLADEEMEPGEQSVQFDASGLASGIYIYRIETGDFTAVRKMTVMK